MRFLVDECTGPAVAGWLRDNGHDIFSVFDEARGMADDDIIRKALSGNWILNNCLNSEIRKGGRKIFFALIR